MERGICPIATLYSLSAAYKGGGRNYLSRGRVVINFVPKFVAMATGVGREKIKMTLSDSAGPKIGGCRCKQRAIIFYGRYRPIALKSLLAVMQNFATFECSLWQQRSLGGKFK